MRPVERALALTVLCAVSAGIVIAGGYTGLAVGDASYDLDVEGALDTPERTITVEGTEHHVDSVGVVDQGSAIVVEAIGPDSTWDVELRNDDEQVEAFDRGSGDRTVTFETDHLDPGTYAVVLADDGSFEVIRPVVVSGYDLTVDHPNSAAPDASVVVEVALAYGARTEDPDSIEIVAYHGDHVVNATATETDSQVYEATLSFEDVPEETYTVYAGARGPDTSGYPTSYAIENGDTLTITTDDDSGGSGDDDSGGSGDDDSGGSGDDDSASTTHSDGDEGSDAEGDDAHSDHGDGSDGTSDDTNQEAGSDDDGSRILDPDDGAIDDDELSLTPWLPGLILLLTLTYAYHRARGVTSGGDDGTID